MNHREIVYLGCSLIALVGGCSANDSGVAGNDSGSDVSVTLGSDSSVPGIDSSVESGPGADTGVDSGANSALDAASDAGIGDASGMDVSEAAMDSGQVASQCMTEAPDPGTNLITDPGFENGGTGWFAVGGGGTFGVTSTEAHCGSDSGEVSGRAESYQGLAYNLPDTTATAASYNVSAWVFQDGAGELKISIQGSGICGDAARSYFNVAFPVLPPNTWMQATGTLSVPVDCVQVYLQIVQNTDLVEDAGPEYPDLFADDVYVTQ
jgi:hypothetical protein